MSMNKGTHRAVINKHGITNELTEHLGGSQPQKPRGGTTGYKLRGTAQSRRLVCRFLELEFKTRLG